jgi:hypothetical protein
VSKRHLVMVERPRGLRCACTLHPCPSVPQLGDPLCRICREHCYRELVRREIRRKRTLVFFGCALIAGVSWLLAKFLGPVLFGG